MNLNKMKGLTQIAALIIPLFFSPVGLSQTPPTSQQLPTSTKASSTSVTPLSPSQSTIKYPGQITPNIPISDEEYSNLPSCPGDPSNPSVANQTPICPDINGNYPPGGSSATCPSLCTVTRKVVDQTIGSVTQVLSTQSPICPVGYAQVTQFNMQSEVTWNSNPPYASYPITASTYAAYVAAGYQCDAYYGGQDVRCDTADSSWHHSLNSNTSIGGFYGYYSDRWKSKCYYKSPSGCKNKVVASDCEWPESWYDRKFYYNYYYYRCRPPAGLYYTSNKSPASLVCSIIRPEWKTRN
ncbi:hypothetical protein [Aquicella lusitana]|uniref:Uncharacterized protein n=1 Tax=Aquicella lusitana TaxID=254246 RepID=A0A370GNY2_9COXI|nr:hypothetical protein [Aquicella lusitana]RDI45221.1 hypothetical protein C8D86_107101 [Aquicella lusitana]VVC72709.1 hypothetical protein AQULUS_04290 [Aquicella lusitana]